MTIHRGDKIEWINNDSETHTIVSVLYDQTPDIINTGSISQNHKVSRIINTVATRIDYTCSIHPQETGTILIPDKELDKISQTDEYRFLSDAFEIKPSGSISHLDSPNRIAREKITKNIELGKGDLIKHFDPEVFDILLNAEEHNLKSKNLVIVFWDISGFSDMCNKLIDEPLTVVDLLKNYFNKANTIIHKHGGIIDKFIGDGILAYFGYYIEQKKCKAIDAIDTALELRDKFGDIKFEWQKRFSNSFLEYKPNIDIKCGIYIGNVLFGLIETIYRNQITLVGSTVNFASRLEDKADKNQIIISKDVLDLVRDKNHYDPINHIIKSYGPTDVYNIKSKRNNIHIL